MSAAIRLALVFVLVAATTHAGTAVTREGKIKRGDFVVSGKKVLNGDREVDLSEYCLIEKDNGTLLFAPDRAWRIRAYALLARHARLKALPRLAAAAFKTHDAPLTQRIFNQAQEDGWISAQSLTFQRKLLKLVSKWPNGLLKVDAARGVAKKFDAVMNTYADILVARAGTAKLADALYILRVALQSKPKHKGALDAVTKLAPKKFALGGPLQWLDFHLDVESRGAKLATNRHEVKRARALWRKDVYAVQSGPMLLVTPLRHTRPVGRCLDYGRVVCKALSDLFPVTRQRRSGVLQIMLFENKEEYVTTSGTERPVSPGLEVSAGYYTPFEGLTRLFWHDNRDAERRVVSTFVHELTHHWTDRVCPRFTDKERVSNPLMPGYWIVEGFAVFMQEAHYDVERQTYNLTAKHVSSMDVVVSSPKKVPWSELFEGVTNANVRQLGTDPSFKFVRRWAIGARPQSMMRMFYDQSGATCHYLYRNGFKKQLIDYMVHYQTGKIQEMSIQRAFGMSPETLGKRVEEFCKAQN